MAVDAGANEAIKMVKKADFKPADEKIIISKIVQFKDNSTRVSAIELGMNLHKDLDFTYLRCMVENKKGEKTVYECMNSVRGFQIYNEEHQMHYGSPKSSPKEMSKIQDLGHAVRMDELVCAPIESPIVNWTVTSIPPIEESDTSKFPSNSPFNTF